MKEKKGDMVGDEKGEYLKIEDKTRTVPIAFFVGRSAQGRRQTLNTHGAHLRGKQRNAGAPKRSADARRTPARNPSTQHTRCAGRHASTHSRSRASRHAGRSAAMDKATQE